MAEENNGRAPELIPQPHGGALLAGGKPGNKGGTGRPSKKFSVFMRELREKAEVHDAIERAAKDETSRGFAPVLNTLKEYDEERPGQKVEVTVLTVEERKSRLAAI